MIPYLYPVCSVVCLFLVIWLAVEIRWEDPVAGVVGVLGNLGWVGFEVVHLNK